MNNLRKLYPPIKPYDTGQLDVGDGHYMYYEQSGNPLGKPVVYLHGGPGAGCSSVQRRVFDPERYRIILFDQRGCGKSTPYACLDNNTTWHLVADMELLRNHIALDRWQLCGGSWGATLALAYAETFPERVTEIILRGVFTMRKSEVDWYYQDGASRIFPDRWEKFLLPIPVEEQDSLIAAYYRRLTGDDKSIQLEAARAWSIWEGSTISLYSHPTRIESFGAARFALAFARIECHYFIHEGWFAKDGWLIDCAGVLSNIPTTIIQGRYDICTPVKTAWDLYKAMPHTDLRVIPDAGHSLDEPGILDALICATDRFSL